MRDYFGGRSEFWWGDYAGWGFYVSVLPQLFTHTISVDVLVAVHGGAAD
jgi:hypothetical protein